MSSNVVVNISCTTLHTLHTVLYYTVCIAIFTVYCLVVLTNRSRIFLLFLLSSSLLFFPTPVLSDVILTVLSYSCSVWCHPHCLFFPTPVLSGVILTVLSYSCSVWFCLLSSWLPVISYSWPVWCHPYCLFSPTPPVWCHPYFLFSLTPTMFGVLLPTWSLLLLFCLVSSLLPILYCSLHLLFCLLLS